MSMTKEEMATVLKSLKADSDVVMVTWKYNRSQFAYTDFGIVTKTPGGTLAVCDRPITGTDGRLLAPIAHLQKVALEAVPIADTIPSWLTARRGIIGLNTSGESHYFDRGFTSEDEIRRYISQGWTFLYPGSTSRYPAAGATTDKSDRSTAPAREA